MDPTMVRNVTQLSSDRHIEVSEADAAFINSYWTRMRALRARVDESLLADSEIGVIFDATEAQRD
jgi:hypothetical protein